MQQRKTIFPFRSPLAMKAWASRSLPKLIMFAMALHFCFTLILVTELHDRHEFLSHVLTNDALRPTSTSSTRQFRGSSTLEGDTEKVSSARRQMKMIQVAIPNEPKVQVDDTYRIHLQSIKEELQTKLNATQVKSCRWRVGDYAIYSENCDYHVQGMTPVTKTGPTPTIVLYNPLHQERILCDGTKIGPKSLMPLKKELSCSESPKLFPAAPVLENADKMDPIELSFGEKQPKFEDFPCDVPCRSPPGARTVGRRIVHGTPWFLQFSMEGPMYYKALFIDEKAHLSDRHYSTTSFQSEIPLPYFSWDEYGYRIQADPVDYDKAIKGAVFMANNCASRNNREGLVKSLVNSSFRVDSVSKCLNNAPKPEGTNNDKIKIMQHYLFYLGFENQCVDDYITEKLWLTFAAGVIPVYYGAPNIKEHVPPHSLINVNDFENTDALVDYLNKVANNRTLYESYHAWRKEPLPDSFVAKYNFTHTHSTCRTCRWAFSRKYGLGWNHETQTVEEPKFPRKICYDDKDLLTHPFRETWLTPSPELNGLHVAANGVKQETCTLEDKVLSRTVQVADAKLYREIVSRDGATDIFLKGYEDSSRDERVILQMGTDIAGSRYSGGLEAFSDRYFRFQDMERRMTILSNRSIDLINTDIGLLEIIIRQPQIPIHLRVFVEDIDHFYNGTSERTYYFGRLMAEDFFNPLERFVVWNGSIQEDDKKAWDSTKLEGTGLIEGADTEMEFAYPKDTAPPTKKQIEREMAKESVLKGNKHIKKQDVENNWAITKLVHIEQGTAKENFIKIDKSTSKQTTANIHKLMESGVLHVHHFNDSISTKD